MLTGNNNRGVELIVDRLCRYTRFVLVGVTPLRSDIANKWNAITAIPIEQRVPCVGLESLNTHYDSC